MESGQSFDLSQTLCFGSLPKLLVLKSEDEIKAYLRSYCLTFIKEEIQVEQVVRRLEPFRQFLELAAQVNACTINFSKIAREIGSSVPTVQSYFQILEDCYVGTLLPHYHTSVRKSQLTAPKFYMFDLGVKRALERDLSSKPVEGTSVYGLLFETFIVNEVIRYNAYAALDYSLSYFQAASGAEVDLVLTHPRCNYAVEIKASTNVDRIEVKKLSTLVADFPHRTIPLYVSRDLLSREVEGVSCMHWSTFLTHFYRGTLPT